MVKKTILSLVKKSSFKSVDDLISFYQSVKYPKKYFYRPIGIEVEITNICNLRCKGCNLIIDEQDKPKDVLDDEEFIEILKDCKKMGMFGYSLTGGEPFLKYQTILKLIRSNHGLDLYKLNTNASFFKSIDQVKQFLLEMKRNGFGVQNKYIKPVLVISLGHQNLAGVPIQNAVNITSQLYNFFDPNLVLCSINITDANMLLAQKIFSDFKKLYKADTRKDFDEKIFQVITTGWNNLGTVEKKEVLDLLEELIEGLKEYHNTYVGLKGASLRREYFDDVKKFQAAIMNADQREKIMHDAFLDKLNRLSRKMKEIGLDNSWRSNEEIWGITPDGKRNKPKFWMFKLFKESDWITKESGDDK